MAPPALLSARARAWFYAELERIAAEDPTAARRWAARFADILEKLGEFPNVRHPSQVPGLRRFVVPPYIVTYRKVGARVLVAAIRHGRQRDARNPT